MLWLPLLVGHQQSWLCAIRMYFSSLRKVFNGLWQLDLEEWYKMRIYLYAPPQFNLYSCFLLLPLHATPYTYARKHTHIHMHTSRSRSTLSRSDSISMSILFITNKSAAFNLYISVPQMWLTHTCSLSFWSAKLRSPTVERIFTNKIWEIGTPLDGSLGNGVLQKAGHLWRNGSEEINTFWLVTDESLERSLLTKDFSIIIQSQLKIPFVMKC